MVAIDRGDFWEFKARCAELDLDIARERLKVEALMTTRNALVDAFAATHGLDAARPIALDDVALTASQEDNGARDGTGRQEMA